MKVKFINYIFTKVLNLIRSIHRYGLLNYFRLKLRILHRPLMVTLKEVRYRLVGFLYGRSLLPYHDHVSQLELLMKEYQQSTCMDRFNKLRISETMLKKAMEFIVHGDFVSAEALLNRVEELFPNNPNIFIHYGSFFRYKEGYYSDHQLSNKIKYQEVLLSKQLLPYCFEPLSRFLDNGWTLYIGHIALLDFHIKAKMLGYLSSSNYTLFTSRASVINMSYLQYFADYIEISLLTESEYWNYENCFKPFTEAIDVWHFKEGFVGLYQALNMVQKKWSQENLSPLLQVKNEHYESGVKTLKHFHIPEESWFVSLHVRGESKGFNNNDPQDGRNCNILSYLPAIRAITEAGGYVLRMGHKGMKALPDLPNVIDYANSPYKSDWMDVFLWSCCRFFIGTTSGPTNVPHSFGVPILHTNAVAIGYGSPGYYKSLMLPKLWYSVSKNRFLTFSEIFQSPCGWCERREFDSDLFMVENTPDEIESGVREMLDLTSCDQTLKYDFLKSLHPLQIKLDEIREQYNVIGRMPVSEFFLEKHSDLIV